MTPPCVPRRDWILLPLTGLLTILLIAAGLETAARILFRESEQSLLNCLVMNDPSVGVSGIPNSVCTEKVGEGELTEYRFNSCGHRAGMECGPKPPGTFRIVIVGSSAAAGLRVPFEGSISALLPRDLAARTGRKIEVYSEATEWGSPHNVSLRFSQALAEQPDMVLWLVTPWDIEFSSMVATSAHPATAQHRAAPPRPVWRRALASARAARTGMAKTLTHSRTAFMLQHFLYLSQSQYVSHFLASRGSAFLQSPPGPVWLAHEKEFETYYSDVQARATGAGVPVVVTLFPHRAQAAMLSTGEWPRGFDPYRIGGQVRSIVEGHGGTYFDLLNAFRRIPNPERYFFPIDGHNTVKGNAVIASLLSAALAGGPVPVLR